MSHEVCFPREGARAKGTLVPEVRKKRQHDLDVIAAVTLLTEGLMFKGVAPSGVVVFLMRVELVKLVGGEWGGAKEGSKEDFRVFIVSREDRIDGEWGERDVDDGQCEKRDPLSGSEAVNDGGIEFVCVG